MRKNTSTITASAAREMIAAGLSLDEIFPGGVTVVSDLLTGGKTAPAAQEAAPKAPKATGKPVTRKNLDAVRRAMTREGWEGHEHMSAREIVELLREANDCPKGFYLPTGAVKEAIAAAKA
jgi:hypothetical protein